MLSCIVVDTETTGVRAVEDRVIEIGAVRIDDGAVTDRFETLVNPAVPVPGRITRLTGIRTSDLVGAPAPPEAFAAFLRFCGDAVLVAHNARFDQSFVEAECARSGLPPPVGGWLCTVRLSRRLLPGLPSHRLDAVARFLGIPVGTRHRALADAEITAGVVLALADRARVAGSGNAAALMRLQGARYAAAGVVEANANRIRKDIVPGLPERPGVYRMLDAAGGVLYVGKAGSLRDRVGSYFVAVEAKSARLRELVRRVRSIEVDVVSTEIEALVREARLIRTLQPRFNRAQLEPGRRGWVRLSDEERSVGVHRFRGRDDATWIGPLSGSGVARAIAEIAAAVTGYRYERRRARSSAERLAEERWARSADRLRTVAADPPVRAVRTGEDLVEAAATPLAVAMRQAADDLAFEEARVLRDWIERLERLDGRRSVPLDGDTVLVAVLEDAVEVVATRNGRLMDTLRVADLRPVADWVNSILSGAPPAGPEPGDGPRGRRALEDERWMLSRWATASGARVLQRGDGEPPDAFGTRIQRVVSGTAAPLGRTADRTPSA